MTKLRGTGPARARSDAHLPGELPEQRRAVTPTDPQVLPTTAERDPDRYHGLVENLVDGVFRSTPEGTLLTANPALVEMLGYESESELLAVDIASQLYYDPGERCRLVDRLNEDGEVRNHELVLRAKDGSPVVVLENARSVRDENGKELYFEGTLTNITAWRDAESLFRILAESSPIGIFIAQDLKFIFVNDTFASMSGYTEDELLATGPLEMLQPEEQDRVLQNVLDMLSGRSGDAFEHRLLRKDGEVLWTLATTSFISYRGRPAVLGNFIDITERKQAQDLLHTLAASSPVAIYIVQDDRFQFVNPQVMRLTGRTEAELLVMHPLDIVEDEDRELVWASADGIAKGSSDQRPYEHRVINRETGDVRWVMDTFTPIVYRGRPALLGNSIDITDRKTAEEQLAHQAFYDSLTDLPNRALFMQRLEHALAVSKRRRKPVAVLFLDLDDFKEVNDSFGHAAGDALLAALAQRLQACVRPMDTVARIGGDEFTVLLDATDWRDDAIHVAERIVDELGRPFQIDGDEAFVQASIGLAFSDPDRHSAADVLREADVALYHAKRAGKGRYVVFGEERQAA